jgi:hypothetical protein
MKTLYGVRLMSLPDERTMVNGGFETKAHSGTNNFEIKLPEGQASTGCSICSE